MNWSDIFQALGSRLCLNYASRGDRSSDEMKTSGTHPQSLLIDPTCSGPCGSFSTHHQALPWARSVARHRNPKERQKETLEYCATNNLKRIKLESETINEWNDPRWASSYIKVNIRRVGHSLVIRVFTILSHVSRRTFFVLQSDLCLKAQEIISNSNRYANNEKRTSSIFILNYASSARLKSTNFINEKTLQR